MHEGKFLKQFIKDKGIRVTQVAKRARFARATIYTHFNRQNLDSVVKNQYSWAFGIKWDENNGPENSSVNKEISILPIPFVPMYNMPASASNIEMYGDPNDFKVVGYLNIPGALKSSFALPVHGHSMYPTLENGSWGVVRPIEDSQDIQWGEIYYIEYGDYRLWKRLIKDDENPDSVILASDNITETVGNRLKYASKTIKLERIKKLCLLTDILKKPNY